MRIQRKVFWKGSKMKELKLTERIQQNAHQGLFTANLKSIEG